MLFLFRRWSSQTLSKTRRLCGRNSDWTAAQQSSTCHLGSVRMSWIVESRSSRGGRLYCYDNRLHRVIHHRNPSFHSSWNVNTDSDDLVIPEWQSRRTTDNSYWWNQSLLDILYYRNDLRDMVLFRADLSLSSRPVQVCLYQKWTEYHRCRLDHSLLPSIDRIDLSEERQQCFGILVDIDRAAYCSTRSRVSNLQTIPTLQGKIARQESFPCPCRLVHWLAFVADSRSLILNATLLPVVRRWIWSMMECHSASDLSLALRVYKCSPWPFWPPGRNYCCWCFSFLSLLLFSHRLCTSSRLITRIFQHRRVPRTHTPQRPRHSHLSRVFQLLIIWMH